MKRFFATAVGVLAIFSGLAAADEVVLKNGDKLTGTVTALADGKLTINTVEAGDVKVSMDQVSTFSTDAPIALALSDGTTTTTKIGAAGPGQVEIGNSLLGNQKVNLVNIDSINAPPADWEGDLKFGGLLMRGNTYSDSVNFGIDLSRTTKQDKIAVNAEYLYGRSKDRTTGVTTTTANNWNGELKYDYNFNPKLYGFADVQVGADQLAFYDLRFVPAAGVGYRWFDKPDFTFTPEAGVAWVYEHFTNGTPERKDFSLKLAYHLTKKFNDNVNLFHNFDYYPSVENGKNYLLDADLGIHADLTNKFFSEFKVVWNYDSNPAIGALKNDERIELNIGYKI
jgi:putative salt-induced outer membrane protein YdiY